MAAARYDVAVIGAGVFGAWIAWHLARSGQRVLLADQYGPAHTRGSSGGETRVIRMAYGSDAIYTRMAQSSLRRASSSIWTSTQAARAALKVGAGIRIICRVMRSPSKTGTAGRRVTAEAVQSM